MEFVGESSEEIPEESPRWSSSRNPQKQLLKEAPEWVSRGIPSRNAWKNPQKEYLEEIPEVIHKRNCWRDFQIEQEIPTQESFLNSFRDSFEASNRIRPAISLGVLTWVHQRFFAGNSPKLFYYIYSKVSSNIQSNSSSGFTPKVPSEIFPEFLSRFLAECFQEVWGSSESYRKYRKLLREFLSMLFRYGFSTVFPRISAWFLQKFF